LKKITKIERQKKRNNRFSLFLDDTFFCGIPENLLLELNLFQGKDVDEEEIEKILEEKEHTEAKRHVIRLFNRRIYSEKDIRAKLKKKRYQENIIEDVVVELKQSSLIDDYLFTKAFVHDRLNLKPKGSFQIAYELKNKGISKTIIDKVFSEEGVVQGDFDRASALAKKKLLSLKNIKDKKTIKRRLYNSLLIRGFPYEVIKKVLEELI